MRNLRGEVIWKHHLREYSAEGSLCKYTTHLGASIYSSVGGAEEETIFVWVSYSDILENVQRNFMLLSELLWFTFLSSGYMCLISLVIRRRSSFQLQHRGWWPIFHLPDRNRIIGCTDGFNLQVKEGLSLGVTENKSNHQK